MVNVTSLTGNGLKDWIVQRMTAVYLLAYTLAFAVVYLKCAPFDYDKWQALFHTAWFQIATAIAVIAIVFHAWVGVWTVTTDYMKHTCTRLLVQGMVFFLLLAQVIAAFMTIWGR